jgi:hypothetical protein
MSAEAFLTYGSITASVACVAAVISKSWRDAKLRRTLKRSGTEKTFAEVVEHLKGSQVEPFLKRRTVTPDPEQALIMQDELARKVFSPPLTAFAQDLSEFEAIETTDGSVIALTGSIAGPEGKRLIEKSLKGSKWQILEKSVDEKLIENYRKETGFQFKVAPGTEVRFYTPGKKQTKDK